MMERADAALLRDLRNGNVRAGSRRLLRVLEKKPALPKKSGVMKKQSLDYLDLFAAEHHQRCQAQTAQRDRRRLRH